MLRPNRFSVSGLVIAFLSIMTGLSLSTQTSYSPGPIKNYKNIAGNLDKVHTLPPGGPAPRLPDGHVDLTGR
jgi:hypothetical protein